jgi:putative tricarboxylic transport membrane protein
VRSVRTGGLDAGARAAAGHTHFPRLFLALGLCLAYAAGLVGRGPPFWLATFLFVFVAIVALQWGERRARGEVGKGILAAALCAAGTAAAVTLVFQELFLVRLP